VVQILDANNMKSSGVVVTRLNSTGAPAGAAGGQRK